MRIDPEQFEELAREAAWQRRVMLRLVTALTFYARDAWDQVKVEDAKTGLSGTTWRPRFSVRNDHGDLARQTLDEINEEMVARENRAAAKSRLDEKG